MDYREKLYLLVSGGFLIAALTALIQLWIIINLIKQLNKEMRGERGSNTKGPDRPD